MKPMRMLIGTLDIGHNVSMLADGFRSLGLEVSTAFVSHNGVFYDKAFDLSCAELYQAAMARVREDRPVDDLAEDPRYAHFFDFDIYLFVASHTLMPGLLDLPILKARGKVVISFQAGSEVRFWMAARRFNAAYGHEFPPGLVSKYVNGSTALNEIAAYPRYLDVFSNKLHNIRMAEMYADVILSQPCSNVLGLRPYMGAILPVDTGRLTARIPDRERPVIVHAPTNIAFKRSDLIIGALHELWAEGLGFELRLLRNVPNSQVIESLTDADVLIDQIACGKSGLLGYEGMASGCVVVGCQDEDASPIPYRCLPVVRIDTHNVKDVLRRVISDAALRRRCAEAGVRYMQTGLHRPDQVARYIFGVLERAQDGDCDYYPTQFVEHPEYPEGEAIPPHLGELTWAVASMYGLPPEADLEALTARHLLPPAEQRGDGVPPTWDLDGARRLFWGYAGPNATWPGGRA